MPSVLQSRETLVRILDHIDDIAEVDNIGGNSISGTMCRIPAMGFEPASLQVSYVCASPTPIVEEALLGRQDAIIQRKPNRS